MSKKHTLKDSISETKEVFEKEYEKTNISEDEAMKELAKNRDEILAQFSKAYLAESGLKPSELELVCRVETKDNGIEHIYFFRKKSHEKT